MTLDVGFTLQPWKAGCYAASTRCNAISHVRNQPHFPRSYFERLDHGHESRRCIHGRETASSQRARAACSRQPLAAKYQRSYCHGPLCLCANPGPIVPSTCRITTHVASQHETPRNVTRGLSQQAIVAHGYLHRPGLLSCVPTVHIGARWKRRKGPNDGVQYAYRTILRHYIARQCLHCTAIQVPFRSPPVRRRDPVSTPSSSRTRLIILAPKFAHLSTTADDLGMPYYSFSSAAAEAMVPSKSKPAIIQRSTEQEGSQQAKQPHQLHTARYRVA